ncbi:hypothetical protein KKG36_02740 [Patescibacteria group bacterium]|nr:hypothetical protein [Patescibacteria group bacterium]
MTQVSESTKKLALEFQKGEKSSLPKEGSATIHVDEVAARVAAFYEKIRGIVDWKEEHLLRRNAIERMLKRRFLGGADLIKEPIAEALILELIRGGHYPNDTIVEDKIAKVQKIVDKYIFILKNTPRAEDGNEALRFHNWLLSLSACEIEEELSASYKERALIDYMFSLMKERIVVNQGAMALRPLKEAEVHIQIYVAVQRALFKLDSPMISYQLLKYKYPDWKNIQDSELLEASKNMLSIRKRIDKQLDHPLADRFYQICERYDTPYLLLGDIMSAEPQRAEEIVANPPALEGLIKNAYIKRVATLKDRLGRAAVYATLSIFITKITLALAIEIPVDKYITHEFNVLSILLNIVVPPLLMFLLVSTIRVPGKGNMDKAILETMKNVYETEKKDAYELKTFKNKRGTIFKGFVSLIYLATFAVSLGAIVLFLDYLNFSVLSSIIFILFVSLIAFTGTRIRQRSRELEVTEEKEGIFSMIIDLFALPLVEVGKWLTQKWQKYNFISTIFNVLVDIPFMVLVEFIEQWRYFLKEKKEKIH